MWSCIQDVGLKRKGICSGGHNSVCSRHLSKPPHDTHRHKGLQLNKSDHAVSDHQKTSFDYSERTLKGLLSFNLFTTMPCRLSRPCEMCCHDKCLFVRAHPHAGVLVECCSQIFATGFANSCWPAFNGWLARKGCCINAGCCRPAGPSP